MSIFGCLVDCARFDPLGDCVGLGTDGRSHQRRWSSDHKDEVQVGEGYDVSSQDDEKLPAESLYRRLCKVSYVSYNYRVMLVTTLLVLLVSAETWTTFLYATDNSMTSLSRAVLR